MKKTYFLIGGLLLIIVVVVVSFISQDTMEDKWEVYTDDRLEIDGIVLRVNNGEPISENQNTLSVEIFNDSDYRISFFYETIELQKKSNQGWLKWKERGNQGQASAEIEYILEPTEEHRFDVQLREAIPYSLMEPGEYRVYLPIGFYCEDTDKWSSSYVCTTVVVS